MWVEQKTLKSSNLARDSMSIGRIHSALWMLVFVKHQEASPSVPRPVLAQPRHTAAAAALLSAAPASAWFAR